MFFNDFHFTVIYRVARRRRSNRDGQTTEKFQDLSMDSSQSGTPESIEDDENDQEGYRSVDKYNSMRVGRTASLTSDAMGMDNNTSVYESTRSESPPSGNVDLFPTQQQAYVSMSSSGGVSAGNSSNWMGPTGRQVAPVSVSVPVPAVKTAAPPFKDSVIPPLEERNLFLRLPRPILLNSPGRVMTAQSPDLMTGSDLLDGSLVVPFYRGNASRSRSRSAGRWRVDYTEELVHDPEVNTEDTDTVQETEDELAGGYDTT